MLYKLVAAAAVIGLSVAAPSAETAAPALTPPTAEEQERIDGVMLRSLVSQLQQKVNKYEALALKDGMNFDTAPLELRNHKSDDPKEKCLNKAKIDYFGCLEDNCLTTQCEQKTKGKKPFNGRKEWGGKKFAPGKSADDYSYDAGSGAQLEEISANESSENQALESLVDTLMAQTDRYEEMLLSPTPRDSVSLTAKPSMKAYFKKWGRLEAMCINKYDAATKAC